MAKTLLRLSLKRHVKAKALTRNRKVTARNLLVKASNSPSAAYQRLSSSMYTLFNIQMTDKITLEEALMLVTFRRNDNGDWSVKYVRGDVYGSVFGSVHGNVSSVRGIVFGNVGKVGGNVTGSVGGTIAGTNWILIETPEQKFRRLLNETENQELIEAFNQLENS